MAAMSLSTPISLLTSISETSSVSARSAGYDGLGRYAALFVGLEQRDREAILLELLERVEHGLVLDARAHEMTLRRRGFRRAAARRRAAAATPSNARLLASVAPEVKMISRGSAPISAATCSRAGLDAVVAPRARAHEWPMPG